MNLKVSRCEQISAFVFLKMAFLEEVRRLLCGGVNQLLLAWEVAHGKAEGAQPGAGIQIVSERRQQNEAKYAG
jgi:hypothetical protein